MTEDDLTRLRGRVHAITRPEKGLLLAPKLALVSWVELVFIIAIPFVASMMARGILFGWSPL